MRQLGCSLVEQEQGARWNMIASLVAGVGSTVGALVHVVLKEWTTAVVLAGATLAFAAVAVVLHRRMKRLDARSTDLVDQLIASMPPHAIARAINQLQSAVDHQTAVAILYCLERLGGRAEAAMAILTRMTHHQDPQVAWAARATLDTVAMESNRIPDTW